MLLIKSSCTSLKLLGLMLCSALLISLKIRLSSVSSLIKPSPLFVMFIVVIFPYFLIHIYARTNTPVNIVRTKSVLFHSYSLNDRHNKALTMPVDKGQLIVKYRKIKIPHESQKCLASFSCGDRLQS